MDKKYLSKISRRLFGAFVSGLLILTLTTGCTSLIKSTVKFSVRNTIGIVEKVPGMNLIIGGSSDLIINVFDIIDSDITVKATLGVVEVISSEIVYAGSTWEEIRNRLNNPHKVAFFLNTLNYKSETGDYAQSPEETLSLGTGDCEDFAIIVYDSLHYHGYETKLLVVYSDNSAHCVGIYKKKKWNKWHYIERSKVSEGYGNMYELAMDVWKFRGSYKDYKIYSSPEEFYIENR